MPKKQLYTLAPEKVDGDYFKTKACGQFSKSGSIFRVLIFRVLILRVPYYIGDLKREHVLENYPCTIWAHGPSRLQPPIWSFRLGPKTVANDRQVESCTLSPNPNTFQGSGLRGWGCLGFGVSRVSRI